MPIDVPVASAIFLSAALGYGARWYQDRGNWRRLRRSEDFTIVETWLHHMASYLRGQKWYMEDFVDMQRQFAEFGEFRSDDPQLREEHLKNIATHGAELDNMAVRMVQLTGRYAELKPPIDDINKGRKIIEDQFMSTAIEYFNSLDQLAETASKPEIDEVHNRYGKPLANGVVVSRAEFEQLWPKLSEAHDLVWQLRNG